MLKQCQKCSRAYKTDRDFLVDTSGWQTCSKGNLWFLCNCGQQLMLTKGRYDWFSPALFMRPAAAEVFKAIAQKDALPHISTTVMEISRLLRDEDAPPEKVATLLKTDPMLAVETLRIANNLKASPLAKPIASLEHAVTFVGRKTVAELAQVAGLKSFKFRTKSFKAEDFWEDSRKTAKIAEAVARKVAPQLSTDEVYIAASLCNIGKVVGAIVYPEKTDAAHAATAKGKLPHWRAAEAEVGAVPHTLLGELGAVVWGLPKIAREAASFHHEPPLSSRPLVGVVTLANQLLHWVKLEPHRIDMELMSAAAASYRLGEKELEALAQECGASLSSR